MSNLQSALEELAPTEQKLQHAWGRAFFLYTNGALSRRDYDAYESLRMRVETLRAALYRRARELLTPLGQADDVPEPTPYPVLPTFETQPGYRAPLPPAPTAPPGGRALPPGPALPPGVVGLGAAPVAPIVWAALVLAVIARLVALGILAWAVWRLAQVGGDTVRGIYLARENTARYERQVDDAYKRFMACLRRTGDPERCRDVAPSPEPPQEEQPPPPDDPLILGIKIVAPILSLGVVGVGGYYAWSKTQGG